MNDLSLHILDIAQNSIRAGAKCIEIEVNEDTVNNHYRIIITDDGVGMTDEAAKKAVDPFFSTRKTRKIGLGLPLLKQNAELCGGYLALNSAQGKGTLVEVVFEHAHIDRPDTGDLPATFKALLAGNPHIRFIFKMEQNKRVFILDTKEVLNMLDDVPINDLKVLRFLEELIRENLNELKDDHIK